MALPDLTGLYTGTLVRFVQRNMRLYAWNGRNRMRVCDGVNWTYAGIYNGPTAISAPTVAVGSASGITGRYRYYIQAVNSKHPTTGNYTVNALESALSNEVQVNNQKIDISGIPATHADSQVDYWVIWRSLNSDYTTFYKVASVALGTTTYTDSVADETLLGANIQLRVDSANNPPTFKWAAVYGDRMFGAGFDPYTSGTVAVTNGSATVTFSAAIPDGLLQTTFQVSGDNQTYVIIDNPTSTTVTLDRVYAGSTAATATYVCFRDPSEVWFSEYNDFESWGPSGEANRNKIVVGGRGQKNRVTGLCALHGELYVFTQDKIYAISGKGVSSADIKITPEPIFSGIGAVGGDSVLAVDNEIYFMSYRGPAVYNVQGQRSRVPELIGEGLGKNWIDAFNLTYFPAVQAGFNPDKNTVEWSLAVTGETENSYTYVYDRDEGTWWPKRYTHPAIYMTDYDSLGQPGLFYGQGVFIFQADYGTSDGVPSGTTTGTVTSSTTTSLTDSGASFYTTGSGLKERYVHIYRKSTGTNYYALVGSRRISSNNGTSITWYSNGSGGGSLTVNADDIYYVGPVKWYWTTKTYGQAGVMVRPWMLHARFNMQGESTPTSLIKTDIINQTTIGPTQSLQVKQNYMKWPIATGAAEVAVQIEGRATNALIAIRELDIEPIQQDEADKDK